MKLIFKVLYLILLNNAALNDTQPETSLTCRGANTSKQTIVYLGYGRYQGSFDSTSGLNVWKGCVVFPVTPNLSKFD